MPKNAYLAWHHKLQTDQAWKDWFYLVQDAKKLDIPISEIGKLSPRPNATWRSIDKCIVKLRTMIENGRERYR